MWRVWASSASDGIVQSGYNVCRSGPRLDPSSVDAHYVRLPVFAQDVSSRYSKRCVVRSRLRLYPDRLLSTSAQFPCAAD